MFFELRQYVVRPGQQKAWVKCMEEEIIPFQVKMGMVILGSFVGEEDDSVYVWIRRFESEAERKRCTISCTRATTGRTRSRQRSGR